MHVPGGSCTEEEEDTCMAYEEEDTCGSCTEKELGLYLGARTHTHTHTRSQAQTRLGGLADDCTCEVSWLGVNLLETILGTR